MRRLIVAALAYIVAYRLGYFMRVPPDGVSAVWPAAGVALGLLVAAPARERAPLAVALGVANVAGSLLAGNSFASSVVFLAASVLEALVGLAIVTRGFRVQPTLTTIADVVALAGAATLGNALSSFVGAAAVSRAFALPWSSAYLGWWTSDGLGMLLVAPLFVDLASGSLGWRVGWSRSTEAMLFLGGWTAGVAVVFHVPSSFVPLPYAMLALLVWAGLRLGFSVVALALFVLALAASTSPLIGYGPSPLGGLDARSRMLLMQAYLGVTAVTGLMLAASRSETTMALAAAKEEEARVHALADHLPDGSVIQLSHEAGRPRFLYVSAGAFAITGVAPADLLGDARRFFDLVHPDDRASLAALAGDTPPPSAPVRADVRLCRPDGRVRWVTLSFAPRSVAQGGVVWDGIVVDVTEQRAAQDALRATEARLQEAQKMELVGQLAGGVAHDFNNLLTVIMGYADLLLDDRPSASAVEPARQIAEAARRAASLTQQLLATGRRAMLTPIVLDLNALIGGVESLLRGTVGEAIRVRLALGAGPMRVKVDRHQLERVLLNFVLNARDAMPDGGDLGVATGSIEIGDRVAHANGVRPGTYVWMSVEDTGIGMSAETRARLFEPFFTTKPLGQGSGLGLASVGGVVRQSDGFIEVESQPGRGSTFRVYLPAHEGPDAAPAAIAPATPLGHEAILLIEDDPLVRRLVEETLQRQGYTVRAAADGAEAFAAAASMPRLDLVISDVMMPGLPGPEVVARLSARYPGLKALFISGYADDALLRRGVETANANFVQKPFTAATLAARVREIMDA